MEKFREHRVQVDLDNAAKITRWAAEWIILPKVSDESLLRDLDHAHQQLSEVLGDLSKLRKEVRRHIDGTTQEYQLQERQIAFVDERTGKPFPTPSHLPYSWRRDIRGGVHCASCGDLYKDAWIRQCDNHPLCDQCHETIERRWARERGKS